MRFAVFLMMGLLAGCFESGEVEVHSKEETQEQPPASDTPVADSVKRPIDRAQAVNDIAMSRKEELDAAMSDAEGTDDDPR
ncbi:MAG: hypothetical protein AAF578_02100 [Pseudomonadota bacterium]